jgi:hypothetical protein
MRIKILFTFYVCCLAWQIDAQTSENNTIVNESRWWSVLQYYSPDFLISASTEYFYFEGDSTFNELSYKKVYSSGKFQEEGQCIGLIREEDKKTYYIPHIASDKEYLVYDFSLEQGMLYEGYYENISGGYHIGPLFVDIDSIEMEGSLKKRIQLSSLASNEVVETWIENVGSLSGILTPAYGLFLSGGKSELLCYHQDNNLVYKNPEYLECYYADADDLIPSLLKHGNQWNELAENISLPPEYQYQKTCITRIGTDTVLNSGTYYKLLTARDEHSNIWQENGYIRESIDIKRHKVFYKPAVDEPEILLYDFKAQVGDKIQSYDFQSMTNVEITVEAIDYISIKGKLRKRMYVRSTALDINCICEENHIWIESVGNMDGLLQSTVTVRPAGGEQISLLCFLQNNELVYKPENTNGGDCFI